MAVEIDDNDLMNGDTRPFVTIAKGMRGWFAILMMYDEDGFWDVWQSGIGSYTSPEGARREAMDWATAEGLRVLCDE